MKTLNDWLSHLETAHSAGLIDMGLSRVGEVKAAMNLNPQCPVIVVAGTNGKGSVCAFLSQIYKQAGFKVGTLTSPHLLKFNERIAVNAEPVSDDTIVASFERIEAARGDISLTYFEFNTLAAVDIFMREQVDVMVLEVGLGGRLDAVNIFDADCAVVTSIDLDHQSFLGDTVEQVGYEKAGVFRSGKPAICGQNPPPESLRQHAENIGAELLLIKRDFDFSKLEQQQWSFHFHPQSGQVFSDGLKRNRNALPIPALRGAYQLNNAACALAVIECLNDKLPIDIGSIKRGLLLVSNPGRFQVLPGRPLVILDVGHNPHAARALRQGLIALPFAQKRTAVFSILADKDIDQVLDIVKDQFDEWYIAPLHLPRGMDIAALSQKLSEHNIENITRFDNVQTAFQAALAASSENDRIIVFGSFHTVAEVMATL
ncbi:MULTISPECIES: bifunctional tetrahydrofolate synthase/dihydrofolate synthase [unclassified Neisseria]|uniref:bifunctional tetrahydrofolate synthase/dihydrofolate synthase n=1 Tax=unclassified Neisseria TaxID=2623750 RepID=UPI002665E493|nr:MULTISPECIES: bifunctional tetrahydrofolate synthase/dihydrofolate synthase [unclassified Neisseria]MDO1510892.1 bifunctional tetrahydrofolate synthase/dihydrofolate synthase [Neisseria sp. MVDL19-042950]MDO1517182.1 bifunctional tetrahydrofolate synthase/dihydrofolate synthase [Neisseria sp. MVDL18-041461]MDO1564549.1 bifunctional tetrahydrofolate synthase/dihydrofolate synthase [Neisseria sp. MVDL20-010259]